MAIPAPSVLTRLLVLYNQTTPTTATRMPRDLMSRAIAVHVCGTFLYIS